MLLERIVKTLLEIIKLIFTTLLQVFSPRSPSLPSSTTKTAVPESVNYHFTRQCNYSCGFCFHTAKTSFLLPLEEAKVGLEMLAKAGMKKINFSGGEPFIIKGGRYLGEMIRHCKEQLEVESVTVVCNGSKVTEAWMAEYGYYLDIMAVSCDSFITKVNDQIGRRGAGGEAGHLAGLNRVRGWCDTHGVLFKLNTVVNSYNWQEDMVEQVASLRPMRWKVFQCLSIEAENLGPGALRQVEEFLVTEQQWAAFLHRHRAVAALVAESNEAMRNSYLILDEYMRFLDNSGGSKAPSCSLLDVGVAAAMDRAGFDQAMFLRRGGKYKWSKQDQALEW